MSRRPCRSITWAAIASIAARSTTSAATANALCRLAPEDADEINRLFEAADHVAAVSPPVAHAPELTGLADRLRDLWQLRHDLGTFAHFRKPVGKWIDEDLKSSRSRAVFGRLMPPETPTIFLLMVLGYLGRGWLSRPIGGTARFRDALVHRYHALGGEALVNTTVEEILVSDGRARGVRLTDGTMLEADVVVSTSSVPETVFRLLAGRYGTSDWSDRMERWKMFRADRAGQLRCRPSVRRPAVHTDHRRDQPTHRGWSATGVPLLADL